MCGHDGRRGYLQHLIVEENERRNGIGTHLASKSILTLKALGIQKIHIHVLKNNDIANHYWTSKDWARRDDILVYSLNQSDSPNA
jgi:ribosomal protein S18 acetylase RimI-like enzyme